MTAGTYFAARGIDERIAWNCGVRERDGAIVWPTVDADGEPSPRRRPLRDGPGPKVRGATGRTLGVWWPAGRPTHVAGDVLVCEGESDALAALSALRGVLGICVASVPGAGFPARVLIKELHAVRATVAAFGFDGDLAGGQNADRLADALVAEGIGARIMAIPPGEDLGSIMGKVPSPAAWLSTALLAARPVGLELAALVAENRWLRREVLKRSAVNSAVS